MTQTLAGADIRGYYTALGIQIPGWAGTEASVRCFAEPDAHQRGDRDPSCSINLEHGAWHCHACGASGGAFDAATVRRYSDHAAIELMVAYGLTERRAYRHPQPRSRLSPPSRPQRPSRPPRMTFRETEDAIVRWQAALAADTDLIRKLTRDRGWHYATLLELELGVDRGRITIPVRDGTRRLIGLLRYQPWPRPGEPKISRRQGRGGRCSHTPPPNHPNRSCSSRGSQT